MVGINHLKEIQMASTDTYTKLKSKAKIDLFMKLFILKKQKKEIEDSIAELEKGYKDEVKKANKDLFFETPDGTKFSIKKSIRKGSINTTKLAESGIDVDSYRNKDSLVFTLRLDK